MPGRDRSLRPADALIVRPIDYTKLRMLRFRTALADFLRRWGIYCLIVVVLFSAGSNAPVTIAAALAGSFVWPLRQAAAHGLAIVPATLAYAAVGTLPVMLTRPLWWPRQWAVAEHALPLAADVIRRSDRLFALLTMAPWQAVLLVGGIAVWIDDGTIGDTGSRWLALGGWAMSVVGSLQLSVLWMQAVRRMAIGSRSASVVTLRTRTRRRAIRRLGTRRALILLPMTRGHANRSALSSLIGPLATIVFTVGPVWTGLSIAWSFAGVALAVLVATSVSRTSTIRELRPLWQDNRHLPVERRTCERARLAVTLLPAIVCALACITVAVADATPLRPQVCALYGIIVVAGCGLEATTPATLSSADHAARWVLMLVAAIAFASEMPSS